jgi:hypothetical protein
MKKSIHVIFILLIISFFSSCGQGTGKEDAEDIAESLLNERIEHGGFGSDEYYSERFWEKTDPEKWRKVKSLVDKAMGNLKGYKLKTRHVRTQVKTNEFTGTVVNLLYDTIYEKGNGMERIILYKPTTGDKFSIIDHDITSSEIQKLIHNDIE